MCLVCISVEFFDRVARIDDPVGAISVHGTNGIWGVISVGLFADGKSNYGGSWNGVSRRGHRALLRRRRAAGGAAHRRARRSSGSIFTISFVFNLAVEFFVGQRVPAKAELEGLDIPEMGALCYPDFVLKADGAALEAVS